MIQVQEMLAASPVVSPAQLEAALIQIDPALLSPGHTQRATSPAVTPNYLPALEIPGGPSEPMEMAFTRQQLHDLG